MGEPLAVPPLAALELGSLDAVLPSVGLGLDAVLLSVGPGLAGLALGSPGVVPDELALSDGVVWVGPEADAVATGPAPLDADPLGPASLAAAIGVPADDPPGSDPLPTGALAGLEALTAAAWLDGGVWCGTEAV